MKNSAMKICNETIHPGEQLSLGLPLPEIFSCAPMYMPIKVIHGKKPGPCLLITSAMHGNELNGSEIINRLLQSKALKNLSGTLLTVPVMNVYGLVNRTRLLPGGVDLDRCFPGSKSGTHAARVANIFIKEIFCHADICLDLKTGFINYTNLPQIYIDTSNPKSKSLAEAFNAPVISNATHEKGMLKTYARNNNIPYLTYVAGEALRYDEDAIKVGKKGIINVLKKLNMLPERQKKEPRLKSFHTETNIWVHASASGISQSDINLGQLVKKNQTLCVVKDPFGATESVTINSPAEAIVVGKNNLPLVYEGEALFQLAVFSKMAHAAEHLEDWEEKSAEQHQKNEPSQ